MASRHRQRPARTRPSTNKSEVSLCLQVGVSRDEDSNLGIHTAEVQGSNIRKFYMTVINTSGAVVLTIAHTFQSIVEYDKLCNPRSYSPAA